MQDTEFLLADDIDVEDITSEQMQLIADEYDEGIADAVALMTRCPGLELYIPASAKRVFDWEYVDKHYTGYNAATLAGHRGLNREDVIRLSKQSEPSRDGLNDHLRLVIERCGMGVARRLARYFPGWKFYIPINGLSMIIKRYIEREFNGTNTQELALKCGVSERHVRQIISDKHQSAIQLSLFD